MAKDIERKMKYVIGASTLVSRASLDKIGLMNEAYFLHSEEVDWATRSKGLFSLGYAPRSIVYHKEGGTVGTAPQSDMQPAMAEYYAVRNRIVFARRFHPLALPTVLTAIATSLLHRLMKARFGNAHSVLKGAFDGLRGRAS